MNESTLQMEKFHIEGEDGDTIVDILRRTTEVVEELNARPHGVVTHIDVGFVPHMSAWVTFRPELDELD